jgi:ligand-binding sensor domain-containing protein
VEFEIYQRLFASVLPQKNDIPTATTHFSRDFVATSKGLAFQEGGRTHVLSTAQGLPNNAVYTILQDGGTLYAGTLGGLVEIEDHRVVRTFMASNSGLKTNWVTAICKVNDRLFVGTYGGGLFELMPSGDIHSFEPETGSFVVNPNAMFSDGDRLYIGTLEVFGFLI